MKVLLSNGSQHVFLSYRTVGLDYFILKPFLHLLQMVYLSCIVTHQVTLSGSVLVHSGRKPTLFWVSLNQTIALYYSLEHLRCSIMIQITVVHT